MRSAKSQVRYGNLLGLLHVFQRPRRSDRVKSPIINITF